MQVHHLTSTSLDKELNELKHDTINIIIMFECVLKAMAIHCISLIEINELFSKEELFLKSMNETYLLKIIQCMKAWNSYLILHNQNKSIPGIHDDIVDAKIIAFELWDCISNT